jgi:2-phosphosulfolactate phosphatase
MGAGSVLAELPGTSSPEAEVAIATFARFRQNLGWALFRCGSGKELVERGFALDVELAAEYAVSRVVPMPKGEQFIDGAARTGRAHCASS